MNTPPAWKTALRLGRVSNVPTVWTNVAAGMALTGQPFEIQPYLLVALAVSFFYVGGMYLNDAFDAKWDAQNRPERPIPSGHVRRATVFAVGFALLGGGTSLIGLGVSNPPALFAALCLAGLIVLYDLSHKGNPLSPLVMALCRVAVYGLAALSVAGFPPARAVFIGGGVLFLYLVFLSTLARKETLHPSLPKMIGTLVAGIALVDAGVLAVTGNLVPALLAVGAFFLTRLFQRSIPGS